MLIFYYNETNTFRSSLYTNTWDGMNSGCWRANGNNAVMDCHCNCGILPICLPMSLLPLN